MNTLIKANSKQIIRSSESKTRKPFRSQVIDGALEREEILDEPRETNMQSATGERSLQELVKSSLIT